MEINNIRDAVRDMRLVWNKHILERMMKRGVSREEVKQAILYGEIIEEYPNDYPFPSCLILYNHLRPLHIVAAYSEENRNAYIITAYIPDSDHFESDLKTRRVQ
ncbi:MAG TPA: hypothetical protein DCQ37_11375 [Desulfobacteraceae bacterium]|nr:hypothetical protein [Desulfobacteraceae bacterium]